MDKVPGSALTHSFALLQLSPAVRDFLNRLWVLMWKSCVYRIRFWFASIIEILLPLVFVILLLVLKKSFGNEHELVKEKRHEPKNAVEGGFNCQVFYTPDNPFTNTLIEQVFATLKNSHMTRDAYKIPCNLTQKFYSLSFLIDITRAVVKRFFFSGGDLYTSSNKF